jgi:senataxin
MNFSRYFDTFSDQIMQLFYESFNEWERHMVVEALSRAGVSAESGHPGQDNPLANVPPPVVYHMLTNLSVLQDPRVISLLRCHPLPDSFLGWPTDPPPPGLLLLMIDENSNLRSWAQSTALKCKVVPMARERFTAPFINVMEAIVNAVTGFYGESGYPDTRPSANPNTLTIHPYSFTTDRVQLWAGFLSILRLIPVELLASSNATKIDLRRIVTGHLHSVGHG